MGVFKHNGASKVRTTAAFAGEGEGQDQTGHSACMSTCGGDYHP